MPQNEFNEYRAALENAGLSLPRKSHLTNKNKELLAMVNHTMTQEEVEEKLRKSGMANRKQKMIQVQVLRRELELARATHDLNKVNKLESELRELGEDVTESSQREVVNTGPKTEQERLAELNRKARKENVQNVKNGQQQEQKKAAERRRAAAKAAKAAAANGESQPGASQVNGNGVKSSESLARGELWQGGMGWLHAKASNPGL